MKTFCVLAAIFTIAFILILHSAGHGADNSLQVNALKTQQGAGGTIITISVQNQSKHFIAYWKVDCIVFSDGEKIIGHAFTNGENLSAGKMVIRELYFQDMVKVNIRSKEFSIGRVSMLTKSGTRANVTRFFVLKEGQ